MSDVKITALTPATYDNAIHKFDYVDVTFSPDDVAEILKHDPYRIFVQCDTNIIPVYLHSNGRGAFLPVADLLPGTYDINGCTLTVLTSTNTGKARGKRNFTKKRKHTATEKGPTSWKKMNAVDELAPPLSALSALSADASSSSSSSSSSITSSSLLTSSPRNRTQSFSSFSFTPSHGLPAPAIQQDLRCQVGSFSPQLIIRDEVAPQRYVTVTWSNLNLFDPPTFLNFGGCKVSLFRVENGKSVFRPDTIPVGHYGVDGVSFSVFQQQLPEAL